MTDLVGNYSMMDLREELVTWFVSPDLSDGIVQVVDVVRRTASWASQDVYEEDVYEWSWSSTVPSMGTSAHPEDGVQMPCVFRIAALGLVFLVLSTCCSHRPTFSSGDTARPSSGLHNV
jgi:hypothetical protein